MRTHTLPILTAGLILLALPTPALPSGEASEDIPITDPVLLERLGFGPDAINVYATPQVYEDLLMSPAEHAAVQQARLDERLAAEESSSASGPFGTNSPGYSSIDAVSFNVRNLGLLSEPEGFTRESARDGLFCESGNASFVAQFNDLPHGARLEFVDLWYWDDSSERLFVTVLQSCLPDFAAGDKSIASLGIHSSVGAPGNAFATINASGRVIDAQSCTYWVRVSLDADHPFQCGTGGDLQMLKVRAQWRRQVSPPPATASFGDVPNIHPFFQHIEALAASGITSGCGGGDFCPNAPLNRGQMAVFLAKALGLHWGTF